MRIIGGKLGGRTILPPKGYAARPTTDFAKEGLFNVLDNGYSFDTLTVLDLFGGTGCISFEFASRGAALVDTVEMNPANAAFIRKTALSLGLDNVNAVHCNVFDFLPLCRRHYDIVFADPPYSLAGFDTIPDKVLAFDVFAPGACFILEHPAARSFASHPRFVKEKKYGNVHFSFFDAISRTTDNKTL